MADSSERAAIAQLKDRLTSTYTEIPPERVSTAVQVAHARFEQSRIRDFVPLLVERRVRAELADAR